MGRPFDPETLAAIRRHLDAPEPREHVAFFGGLAFEDGGRMVVASDEQILDAILGMDGDVARALPETSEEGASLL